MFNIQVGRNELLQAITAVESTVGNNSQNLGDDCISITDTGMNNLEIYTTNGVEFSKVNIILTTGSSGTVEKMPFINFKRFKSMIDSVPIGEYITIKATVNDIEITYGRRKKPIKLSGSTNGMIPLPSVNGQNEIVINKDVISYGMVHACTIIKDDGNNALTNCMRINTNSFNVEITAIDVKNNRMYLYNGTTTESNTGDILIEANKFKKAFKLFDEFRDLNFESNGNIVKIFGSDPHSNNTFISAEYYVRSLSGNYPTMVTSMINGVNDFIEINKDEMKSSLIRINAIEDNTIGNGTMDIMIDGKLVNITKTSQYGIVEDSFDAEKESTFQIKDTFKAKAMAEILKTFADNGSYNTPNTFEIGKGIGANNLPYYVLRESGNVNSAYFITGLSQSTNP